MMAVAFEEQAALSIRAGGIETGDRLAVFAQDAMLTIDREPAFGMHEHCADRPKRSVRSLAEFGSIAGVLIVFGHRLGERHRRDLELACERIE